MQEKHSLLRIVIFGVFLFLHLEDGRNGLFVTEQVSAGHCVFLTAVAGSARPDLTDLFQACQNCRTFRAQNSLEQSLGDSRGFVDQPVLDDQVDVLQDGWHGLAEDLLVVADELHHEGFRAFRKMRNPGIEGILLRQTSQLGIGSDIPIN